MLVEPELFASTNQVTSRVNARREPFQLQILKRNALESSLANRILIVLEMLYAIRNTDVFAPSLTSETIAGVSI